MPEIKLEGIAMKFGDFYAVKGIDMTISSGEYVTILGPSGCGKTTLIKVVSGILRPSEGRILIDGKDVTDVPLEDRDTGYVFQNIALFPNMDNEDNVRYSGRVNDRPPEETSETATKYLKLVNMLNRAGMFPQELSGGEQQKVAIARALASGSKLLMLDEPLSALDARVRMELRYEIRRMVKELGITVLHVTHDQEEAMSVSDRIILMRSGTIHEIGSPIDMYRNPRSIFAAYFIGETNLMECTYKGLSRKGKPVIRLRGGETVRIGTCDLEEGDAAVLSVRPEHVYQASEGGIKAEVLDVVFMGTYWRIRTVAETSDYIDYNITVGYDVPHRGDTVRLVFNKAAARVFARPKEGLGEAIRLE